MPDPFRACLGVGGPSGPLQIGNTASRFARARQMAIRTANRRQFKAIRTTFRQFGALWRKCGRKPFGFSGLFRQFGTRDLRYYNLREGHAMSRGGASRRHGHGATAAGSAGARCSRILPHPAFCLRRPWRPTPWLRRGRAPECPWCRYGVFGPRPALVRGVL